MISLNLTIEEAKAIESALAYTLNRLDTNHPQGAGSRYRDSLQTANMRTIGAIRWAEEQEDRREER